MRKIGIGFAATEVKGQPQLASSKNNLLSLSRDSEQKWEMAAGKRLIKPLEKVHPHSPFSSATGCLTCQSRIS